MYTFTITTINIIVTAVIFWLSADILNFPLSGVQSWTAGVLCILTVGGAIPSSLSFKELAERRLIFNTVALACIIPAYMLSG